MSAATDTRHHADNTNTPPHEAASANPRWHGHDEIADSWKSQSNNIRATDARSNEPRSLDLSTPIPGYEQRQPYKLESRQPVDYRSIASGGGRVIAMAETHETGVDRDEFARSLKQMKEGGVTHVAIEGLRKDQETDEQLAAYKAARASGDKDAIAKARKPLEDQFLKSGTDSDKRDDLIAKHFKMVDAALDADLKITGLEPAKAIDSNPFKVAPIVQKKLGAADQSAFDTYFSKDTSESDRAKAREQLLDKLKKTDPRHADADMAELDKAAKIGIDLKGIKLGLDFKPGPHETPEQQQFSAKFGGAYSAYRDRIMAQTLDGVLSTDPSAKVLMFAGARHFGYGSKDTPTVSEQLSKYDPTVISFAGGDYQQLIHGEQKHKIPPSFQSQITTEARRAGARDEYFQLRITGQQRSSDIVIHRPEGDYI